MWQKTHAKTSTNTESYLNLVSTNTWVVYTFAVPLSACFGLGTRTMLAGRFFCGVEESHGA